jgi:prophage antirepressor-like protein
MTPFLFEEQPVRVIQRDGQPWFVAADVCKVLEIETHRDAIARLDDDEKGVALTDTLEGAREVATVNESGLYALILLSRQAVTPGTVQHRFRKWVAAELLPALRRAGRPEALDTPMFMHGSSEHPEDTVW